MSTKKEFSIVSKLLLDFINDLTESQFNNLLDGTADIRYYDKGLDNEKKELYNRILYKIVMEDDATKKIDIIRNSDLLSTKQKMIDFCKYFKIGFRVKDSNDILIGNIIEFIDKNKDTIIYKLSKQDDLEASLDAIAKKLEDIMDIKEAKKILEESKSIQSKTNLMKLAKKLKVFVDRDATYEAIADNIVKSVVESKIRSYTIRNKI